MRYCNNCIIPDTKPGIDLDKSGLCNACRNVNIKNNLSTKEKLKALLLSEILFPIIKIINA